MNSDIIEAIRDPKMHAMHFEYNGIEYVFSGWWILEWDSGDKEYDSIEDFITDPFFDGKTFLDISTGIKEYWMDKEP